MRLAVSTQVAAVAFALLVASPSSASAQDFNPGVSRAKLLGINAAIGGITAGVSQAAMGRSFWKGMLEGSIGGSTVYAGKCLIAQRTVVGNWVGRGTVNLGSSVVANASAGRPMLQQLVAPLGPFRLQRNGKTGRKGIKLNLSATIVAAYFAAKPHTSFAAGSSLEHAALVFNGGPTERDAAAAGVILLGDPASVGRTMAHELTHVAQDDFVTTAWEEPFERWLFGYVPGGDRINKYVYVGLLKPILQSVGKKIDYRDRPWEQEARSIGNGC
jgi:hypothetical protein